MKHVLYTTQGFTLIEILTAVIIVAILVVMAMPLYEKTIERSHLAEVRTILAKLQDAKIQTMDNMGCTEYTAANVTAGTCPGMQHLNVAFATTATGTTATTKDFKYTLVSATYPNAVCAKRLNGEYANTTFVYQGSAVDGSNSFMKCSGINCENYGFVNETFSCTF